MVVAEAPIAVDLGELAEEHLDVFEDARPLRMPGHEHALPRREMAIDIGPNGLDAALQAVDLALPLGGDGQHGERIDLFLKDANRFFEFQKLGHGN